MTLQWETAPYGRSTTDQVAEARGVGRYRVKKSAIARAFHCYVNGNLFAAVSTMDAGKARCAQHFEDAGRVTS